MESTEFNKSIWENQHHLLTTSTWAAPNWNAKQAKILSTITKKCSNLRKSNIKLPCSGRLDANISTWSLVMWKIMQRNVWSGSASWLMNKTKQPLYKVSTPCLDDHKLKEEQLGSVGELSKVCSQVVLKCLYLAHIGRPGTLSSVNKRARTVTKDTRARDRRMDRLIS